MRRDQQQQQRQQAEPTLAQSVAALVYRHPLPHRRERNVEERGADETALPRELATERAE